MKLEDVEQQINEWYGSEECDEHFDFLELKFELKEKRYNRFENYIKENDFKKLMERLISEHDSDYINKCILKGYNQYPNNKLSFIFDYVFNYAPNNYKSLFGIELIFFPDDVRKFSGFHFQIIYGQGTIYKIFDKNEELLLSL
ncbi:MAG: hypothetical protein DRI95_08320 [Bacteroidetes bacterium]|nr:MAG: hypothetical protein DRI95_08320 [Bacteroidota bacterium]